MKERFITKEHLRANPDEVFVFGDNNLRKGRGGAAALRDEPNTYGFITKKEPNNNNSSFYTVEEYTPVFDREFKLLDNEIKANPDRKYLISKLGAGLANKYGIWEHVILPGISNLLSYENVELLFPDRLRKLHVKIEVILNPEYPNYMSFNPHNIRLLEHGVIDGFELTRDGEDITSEFIFLSGRVLNIKEIK